MQSSANINVAEMLIRYFLMFSPKVEKNLNISHCKRRQTE